MSRFVAAGMLLHLVWLLALAANPGLHAWAHQGHGHSRKPGHRHDHQHEPVEHHCVVDLLASGSCTVGSMPAAVVAPLAAARPFDFPVPAEPTGSVRKRTGILEHAPPAQG